MGIVTVTKAVSGYLPTHYWGKGDNMERETYALGGFERLEDAERAARHWAEEREAEYRPYRPIDENASLIQALLVKKLREEQGLDLHTAIRQAREILAQAA